LDEDDCQLVKKFEARTESQVYISKNHKLPFFKGIYIVEALKHNNKAYEIKTEMSRGDLLFFITYVGENGDLMFKEKPIVLYQ
jgi:hypothetical protein